MKTHVTGVLALVLIATLGLSFPAGAQSGSGEGIKVHGRWTIDIRNPDGTLASHHEFDNALFTQAGSLGGDRLLAGLLGRHFPLIQRWRIIVGTGVDPDGICFLVCTIEEQLTPGPPAVNQLSVHIPVEDNSPFASIPAGTPAGTLELRGMTRADKNGVVRRVSTALTVCRSVPCETAPPRYEFTSHFLGDSAIAVLANQIVQVTVVFSFS